MRFPDPLYALGYALMPAGRKPVPAETRRQRGERGRPLPVVIGGRTAPPMPPGLDKRMQRLWHWLVGVLTRSDTIDLADAGIIEAATVAWARAQEFREAMTGQPLLISTPQGPVINRLIAEERAAWKEFRALAESLPLSPWGRARLGLKGAAPADQVEQDIGLPPRLRAVGDGD